MLRQFAVSDQIQARWWSSQQPSRFEIKSPSVWLCPLHFLNGSINSQAVGVIILYLKKKKKKKASSQSFLTAERWLVKKCGVRPQGSREDGLELPFSGSDLELSADLSELLNIAVWLDIGEEQAPL